MEGVRKGGVSTCQSLSNLMYRTMDSGKALLYSPFNVSYKSISTPLKSIMGALYPEKILSCSSHNLYQKVATVLTTCKSYVLPLARKNDAESAQLLMKYNAECVNALLHIDASRELRLDSQARACGNVLVEHDVEETVAITRSHHHYKLEKNERVVLTIADSTASRSKDTAQSKGPIIVKVPRAGKQGDVPYIFRFDKDGAVIPLEYISCDSAELAKSVEARMKPILSNREFLKALFEKIKAQGNLEHLGFQAIVENEVLPPPSEEGLELHEDNWPRYQEVSYRKLTPGQDATVTSWRFGKGPKQNRCYCVSRMFCHWTGMQHMRLSDGHNQYD